MIKTVMEISVQEVCFSTVGGDGSIIIPESWDCGILLVKHLDDFPKLLITLELQVVNILLFVFAQECHYFVSDGLIFVP